MCKEQYLANGYGGGCVEAYTGTSEENDAYEVFGKGSPIIYVNGRLLRDLSELDQLKSEDIKNVELITSPGARYDASVKAVVKITTRPIKGEGFGFDVRSGYNQWEYAGFVEQLNWNYRRDKLDVFGTVYYRKVKGLTKVGLLKMCMLIRFGIRTIISSQKRINRHLPISQV